jgi:predicted metal-dependent hydrolase
MKGDDAIFRRGAEQFNRGEFFDAHETWEVLWLEATGRDKIFLQATIQIAAAFHHWGCGNRSGTLSLLRRGVEKLAGLPHSCWGVRVDQLREQAARWCEALSSDTGAPGLPIPKIEFGPVSPTLLRK